MKRIVPFILAFGTGLLIGAGCGGQTGAPKPEEIASLIGTLETRDWDKAGEEAWKRSRSLFPRDWTRS
jgi:hypothetical protein